MSTIKELSDLSGRRALITGATGGLGRVFANTLAELGADLVLVDLPSSDFQTLSKSLISDWKVKVDIHPCDLEVQNQRADLISELMSSGLGLNVLINNAAFVGTSDLHGWGVPFKDQSIDTWRRALEVNLTAVFDLSKGLSPLLKLSKNASIINIASNWLRHYAH